jgi:diguanylate cyclase (GGDEF)-like protein
MEHGRQRGRGDREDLVERDAADPVRWDVVMPAVTATLVVLVVLTALSALWPVEITVGPRPVTVTAATTLGFATMLHAGLVAGVVAFVASGALSAAVARTVTRDLVAVLGCRLLAVAAAAGVLAVMGNSAPVPPVFGASDLGVVALAGLAFVAVEALVSRAPVVTGGVSFVLVAASPAVVVVAAGAPALLPLVLVPVLVVRNGARRKAEEEHRATHDPLTGLPNRGALFARASAVVRAEGGALVLLGLDRFREVNETFGPEVGDALLREAARRVARLCPAGAFASRSGGDTFSVLLPAAGDAIATTVAHELLEVIGAPAMVGDLAFELRVSAGVVGFGAREVDAGTLLRRAELAMEAAKRRGVSVERYASAMDGSDRAKLGLISDLRRAIDDGGIDVWFQPKVDLRTGAPVGAEALVRWSHPELGLVGADEFVPAAEQSGLIRQLTFSVIETAVAAAATWHARGHPITVAVNVSPRWLHELGLPTRLAAALRVHGLQPSQLVIEITESSVMEDPAATMRALADIRALGVGIALDDYGTGYSSLAVLKDLPVTEIKIDQSFVRSMADSAPDALIVASTIDLAHGLGLKVVAEGIENAAIAERLTALGCDTGQGYHFGRPMPAAEFASWLR